MDLMVKILGGVGLLLLGMKLMTDGLKLAGGRMLRRVLRAWTNNGLRGLLSGFLVTALVQSSGAVTVAAIGFVNAGLMAFRQAVWVIYGSNIGTTTTAWIVALLGFQVNIKAFALPMVAVGVGLWLLGGASRKSAMGQAVAGFGVFFLGVEALQQLFPATGISLAFHGFLFQGLLGELIFLAMGLGLTVLMQSSSASIAVILTAASSGLPLVPAAAAVIGANLGSTSTAAIVVIGSTPGAKRLATMHVIFNLLTAAAALGLLRLMLLAIAAGRAALSLGSDPASTLALFHTAFNVLGVLLLWPLTGKLTAWVERRFRTKEEDEGTPRFLDNTVLRTPPLGADAMILEAGRLCAVARRMALNALEHRNAPPRVMLADMGILTRLRTAMIDFAARLNQGELSKDAAESLPRVLRVAQYAAATGEMAAELAGFMGAAGQVGKIIQVGAARNVRHLARNEAAWAPMRNHGAGRAGSPDNRLDPTAALAREMEGVLSIAAVCVANADAELETFSPARLGLFLDGFERGYQGLKAQLLQMGSEGTLDNETMVELMENFSHIRRMVEQAAKGAQLLYALRQAAILRKRGGN